MKSYTNIILFILPFHLIAQNTYFNIYSEGNNNWPGDILVLESGSILVPVLTQNDTSWFPVLYKFDKNGNDIGKLVLPNNSEEFTNIQRFHLCDDGNLLAFGDYYTGVEYYQNLWVLKMDTSFNIIDNFRYQTGLSPIAMFNSITDSFGYIILFCNTQDPANLWKNFVFRLNQNGDSLYAKIYDTPGIHVACDILGAQNGTGYYLFSMWPELNTDEGQISIVEVDHNFVVVDIVGTTNTISNSSAMWFNDTSFIASGQKVFKVAPFSTDVIYKVGVSVIGLSGTVIDTFYWGQNDTLFQPGAYDNLGFHDDNIYYGGVFNFQIPYNIDVSWVVLTKLDSNLNLLWQKFLGGDQYYELSSIYVLDDGSCLMVGHVNDFLNGDEYHSLFLLKIGPNGEFFSNPEMPNSPMDVKLYPNPGSDFFMLDIQLNSQQNTIKLYDINGRLCHTQTINNGSNPINTQNLTKGMYVFKIISDNKLVLSNKWMKE